MVLSSPAWILNYHYVVEDLSDAGTATEVIIELTTAIPKDAVLRRYSLVTGWDNFVINNDNIKSKTSTDNTCTPARLVMVLPSPAWILLIAVLLSLLLGMPSLSLSSLLTLSVIN
jgi:hypothetical protein